MYFSFFLLKGGFTMSEQTIFDLLHSIEHVTHKMLVKWGQVREQDLGISHILVLHHLREKGESRPSHLAKTLNFTPASLTHLSTKLIDKNLISRRSDDFDRRISFWEITKEGIELVTQAHSDGQILWKELFTHITEEEQETLLVIYKKLKLAL